MNLIFASNNPHKLEEIRASLGSGFNILSLASLGLHEEIPETQNTLHGNALQKARFVHAKLGRDCFADDTGLEIEALGGQPGVLTARFAGEGCTPAQNREKTLRLLAGVAKRNASFRTVIALILRGREYLFTGQVAGSITTAETGEGGFGYDPIFQPTGFKQTYAEMDLGVKIRLSHRALAAAQMKAFLESLPAAEINP